MECICVVLIIFQGHKVVFFKTSFTLLFILKIGDYNLSSLCIQEFFLDGGAMFGVVPKPLWKKVVLADSINRVKPLPRLLLISGTGRNILVDTGLGTAWTEKLRSIYSRVLLLPFLTKPNVLALERRILPM
jgi:hypothetical protein